MTSAAVRAAWLANAAEARSTARLPLQQYHDSGGNGQDRQEVTGVGEVDLEKWRIQKAEQDEPNGQQEHPQVLGNLHRSTPIRFRRQSNKPQMTPICLFIRPVVDLTLTDQHARHNNVRQFEATCKDCFSNAHRADTPEL
jgi:hypothetical protein